MKYRNRHKVIIYGASVEIDIEAEYYYTVASFGTGETPPCGAVALYEVNGFINGEWVKFESWPAALADEIINSIHRSPPTGGSSSIEE